MADVDGDGKDEIVYGSMVVDDNGMGLFSTGLRHGDALHVGDMVPSRPGLEVFGVHESEGNTLTLGTPGMALYDALTARSSGASCRGRTWAAAWPRTSIRARPATSSGARPRWACWTGRAIAIADAPASVNHAVWWDADPLREIEDANWISKWDWNTSAR